MNELLRTVYCSYRTDYNITIMMHHMLCVMIRTFRGVHAISA